MLKVKAYPQVDAETKVLNIAEQEHAATTGQLNAGGDGGGAGGRGGRSRGTLRRDSAIS